jgi:hypothetical protein
MGLKSYRLWVMGQLDYNVQSPTARELHAQRHALHGRGQSPLRRAVAPQVLYLKGKL